MIDHVLHEMVHQLEEIMEAKSVASLPQGLDLLENRAETAEELIVVNVLRESLDELEMSM
jgi:hypothetical protein